MSTGGFGGLVIEEVYLLKPSTNAHLFTDCRVLRNREDFRAYPVSRVSYIYPRGQPIPTWMDSGRFPHKISRAICRYCGQRWVDEQACHENRGRLSGTPLSHGPSSGSHGPT